MKNIFRTCILHILIVLARRRLVISQTKVIGITGSIGKTTCRDALIHVLSEKYNTQGAEKSYNTEFGLPLTILEEQSGNTQIFQWLTVLSKSLYKALFQPLHAHYIILEYGVDKPGDMDTLLDICVPDIAVLIIVAANHLAPDQFASIEEIFQEKIKLIEKTLLHQGTVYVNKEDPLQNLWLEKQPSSSSIISYSKQESYENIQIVQQQVKATIHLQKTHLEQCTLGIIGSWHLETLLPAVLIGEHLDLSKEQLLHALSSFHLPPGRLSLIPGKNNITLLDSSYNASASATKQTLSIFQEIQRKRNVFLFGNMNELGIHTEEFHRSIAPYIMQNHVDLFIGVGEGPQYTAEELIKSGFNRECIFLCADVFEAISVYEKCQQPEDLILAKGSQNKVRLEYFIKAFMKYPEQAPDLLVRQSMPY